MRIGYKLLVLDIDKTIYHEGVLRPGLHEFLKQAYAVRFHSYNFSVENFLFREPLVGKEAITKAQRFLSNAAKFA